MVRRKNESFNIWNIETPSFCDPCGDKHRCISMCEVVQQESKKNGQICCSCGTDFNTPEMQNAWADSEHHEVCEYCQKWQCFRCSEEGLPCC